MCVLKNVKRVSQYPLIAVYAAARTAVNENMFGNRTGHCAATLMTYLSYMCAQVRDFTVGVFTHPEAMSLVPEANTLSCSNKSNNTQLLYSTCLL